MKQSHQKLFLRATRNNKKTLPNPKPLTEFPTSVLMPDTNPILEPLFRALDPISLILNQNNSLSDQPVPLRLTTVDSFIMERGPRYEAYAELRETKLRMKQQQQQQQQEEHEEYLEPKLATPPKKQVKFQVTGLANGRKGSSSVLARSVPDFSAALRKENRRPMVNTLPSILEMTPPSKSSFNKGNSNTNGVFSGSRGSKSESAGDKKKKGVLMARKSYASVDELRSLSSATASAINGEGRGARNNRVMGRSVSGHYRQF